MLCCVLCVAQQLKTLSTAVGKDGRVAPNVDTVATWPMRANMMVKSCNISAKCVAIAVQITGQAIAPGNHAVCATQNIAQDDARQFHSSVPSAKGSTAQTTALPQNVLFVASSTARTTALPRVNKKCGLRPVGRGRGRGAALERRYVHMCYSSNALNSNKTACATRTVLTGTGMVTAFGHSDGARA